MTNDQLQYKSNCRRSKELCAKMEELKTELASTGDILKPELHQYIFLKIEKIMDELDVLWDEQIELQNQIKKIK